MLLGEVFLKLNDTAAGLENLKLFNYESVGGFTLMLFRSKKLIFKT